MPSSLIKLSEGAWLKVHSAGQTGAYFQTEKPIAWRHIKISREARREFFFSSKKDNFPLYRFRQKEDPSFTRPVSPINGVQGSESRQNLGIQFVQNTCFCMIPTSHFKEFNHKRMHVTYIKIERLILIYCYLCAINSESTSLIQCDSTNNYSHD